MKVIEIEIESWGVINHVLFDNFLGFGNKNIFWTKRF